MWVLTNKKIDSANLSAKKNCISYSLYVCDEIHSVNDTTWLYEGYIQPRENEPFTPRIVDSYFFNHYVHRYSDDFIHHMKGNFFILHLENNSFKIYSDRFGIKKLFYWINGDDFIISNDLKVITQNIAAVLSAENMAIYALTYHFIGSQTIFENIHYSRPGEVIEFKDGKLNFSRYWRAEELLDREEKSDIQDIAAALEQAVGASLKFQSAGAVSLSLTAGVDSRLLLSILLNVGVNLHTYTYGHPRSIDCVLAQKISADLGIEYSIHDVQFDHGSFYESAIEVIQMGQTLCSLHRAHRLEAIKQESQFTDMMFLGSMGGEFVKGANHDDYIISNFVYEFSQNQSIDVLRKYLQMKKVRLDSVDCDGLMDFFRQQNWCKYPDKVDFYGLFEIAAGLHHAQNDMLYQKYIPKVFTPFLDIDYLRVLFNSDYHFLAKRRYSSHFRQRLENHRFSADLQHILNPSLTKFPYNSGFKVREYRMNPVYAALMSRARKKLWKYPPNFPLKGWMREFVMDQLLEISRHETLISETLMVDDLMNDLLTVDANITTEAQWLKYTTPVQMHLIMKAFC